MTLYKRILVICPGNAQTAGPEALHQLVSELNQLGQAAAIVYHPFNKVFSTPTPYQKYQTTVSAYEDHIDELIIFPEIYTTLALKVKNAKAAVWWMSVNNYTCLRYGNLVRDKFRYFKNFIKGKRPFFGIKSLKHLMHFAQSNYANDFLMKHGIASLPLSDAIPVYTSQLYLNKLKESPIDLAKKENIILFNPSKGAKIIAKLMKAFPNYQFKPLKGYDREALAAIFMKSKLYVDFGHHPGKDRLPREAAIHGCCVITGIYGSASNAIDLPFPVAYKLDQKSASFFTKFHELVSDIFIHFDCHYQNFNAYRAVISAEENAFQQQIMAAFFKKSV